MDAMEYTVSVSAKKANSHGFLVKNSLHQTSKYAAAVLETNKRGGEL